MAKVRVYELARELDLESKDLVEKLLAGGMSIKNYMSTLDEAAVIKAREIVSGVISEVIEEKRIKSTVIRRRKKKVRIEPEVPAAEVAAKAEEDKAEALKPELPAEEVPPPEEPPERQPPAEENEPVTERVKKAASPKGKAKKKATAEKVAKPKKAKKKKAEKAAKIIKRPEEGPLKDILARKAEKKSHAAKRQKSAKPTLETLKFVKVEKVVVEPEKVKPKAVKKKKYKKQKETQDAVPKGPLRRIKKEIYEKADLYQGRRPRRKGKKGGKTAKDVGKKLKHTEITVPKAIKRKIRIQESVTIADLAKAMGIKAAELIKRLLAFGVTFSINQSMDFETASVVADDLGYELELDSFEEENLISETADKPEDLEPRPPVVTIMGHVDHGKTSLLDYIRKSNIIGRESGGITQHIGAYYVKAEGGDIVFLDTPGHEAFTAMRARGSEVTDLIVLVVAADDGVMPQTKEAVNHGRAADIPIIVAVNKMDKAEADPEKVKRELAELDLTSEDWGGETIFGHISAKTGEGVDDLLALILLQSEVLELKGNPNKPARGTVIEARLDKSKGPVATVLIKTGTLSKGVYFVCGEHYGRVRAMNDHRGRRMKSAGPSLPVEIYGISGVPMAGDKFIAVEDEKTAKQVIEYRKAKSRKQKVVKRGLVSLDDLYDRIKEGDIKELNIVLKADVQGSLEALSESLVKQSTDEVKLKIIHSATGAIAESDIMLASASGAIIIGFNVRANPRVSEIAEKENVDIRYYDVIYIVINDIRLAMAGLLEPVYKEHIIGRVDIKEIFHVPKVGSVAGCLVSDGHVERNANIRLLRDDVVVFDGKIASLRRFKEDTKEVQSGYECGIGLENYQDVKPGDVFEVYEIEEVEAEL
ncbi:MAG: translation initiation factor IF-2 [Deltaproteobacteria bacterium]|nr:translation initiation factor IF-2 [Deltaproteobacteria bacterium]